MKGIFFLTLFAALMFGYTCDDLIKKYNAPNPEKRTMKQLKRWFKKHTGNILPDEREDLFECLIDNAADNPNREMIAGE